MAMHRTCTSIAFALVLAACGDSDAGGESTTATTTAPSTTAPSSGTTDEPGTDTGFNPGSASATTGQPTSAPDLTTGAPDPTVSSGPSTLGTATGDLTTGDDTTSALDTGGDDTTTGGFDPAHLPDVPDDGLPPSAHQKQVPLGTSDALNGYLEYLPPGYGGGDLYPLMVFLHGIGENGDGVGQLGNVANNGPPALIKWDQWDKTLPFVVLSPQHPSDGGCPNPGEVQAFLDFAVTHYDINPARVYLTGLSCGAIGSWNYLGAHLDSQITALVPIAGDGNGAFGQSGCELGRVPIWAFHGDADNVVGVGGTINPVTSLQMCDPKPDVEMVIYPGVGHDSWTQTYDKSAGHDIYAWFLAHVKQP
ncbi:MAG: prolyl oligopeptidase family serine peptidase [Myxococcales bacterium]|nr:prolyl oligopeptidase family serine peptidase [Myxococcales bacterium]